MTVFHYMAWDVSTSVIGACLLTEDGVALNFDWIDLTKFETMPEKYQHVSIHVPMIIDGWCRDRSLDPSYVHHFVEDRLGNFSKGATTLQTLMKLSAINAVTTSCIINHGQSDPRRVTHILPVTAKKWAGLKVPKGESKKVYAVRFARDYSPAFPYSETKDGNPRKGVEDMADALVTGVAGLRMRSAGALSPGKAKAAPKKPRRAKDRKEGKGRVRLPLPDLSTPEA
jgi:hypothetical protein